MPYKNPEDSKARKHAYYLAHREEIMAKTKAWRETHLEEYKAKAKLRYQANREEINAAHMKWYETHKAEVLEGRKRYYALHREERLAKNAEWRRTHSEQSKKSKRRYYENHLEDLKMAALRYGWADMGVDVKEAESLWNATDNCQICGVILTRNMSASRKMLDHDHRTRRIRGVLCHKCNVLLGSANDDPKILARAIRYLEASTPPVCSYASSGEEQNQTASRTLT